MHLCISLITLLATINVVLCIVCTENFCSEHHCEDETCEKGQILIAGTCGCCRVCTTVLKEGETCGLFGAILSPKPPKSVCAEHLICYKNKCQKEKDVLAANNNE